MSQATLEHDHSVESRPALYVALELSKSTWKLAMSDGRRRTPRIANVPARDLVRLEVELRAARQRFGLPTEARVLTCYEAGRDGFWIHRALEKRGVTSLVVDAASIEVTRRRRRAKTDRIDAQKLVAQLIRHWRGERVWSVVRVPEEDDEDFRQPHRELEQLKREVRKHRVRLQSLLFAQGIDVQIGARFAEEVASYRRWDGTTLPERLQRRLLREWQRLRLAHEQSREVEKERDGLLDGTDKSPRLTKVRMLAQLRGVGASSAWLLVMEFFGWRGFANRREVGAAAGFAPTPFQSGASHREQGISKAGNPRVRSLMVELAWCWLRYQPDCKHVRWFRERFSTEGSRRRRVGIVALARRLLVDFWRYLEHGVVPDGALLKTA